MKKYIFVGLHLDDVVEIEAICLDCEEIASLSGIYNLVNIIE